MNRNQIYNLTKLLLHEIEGINVELREGLLETPMRVARSYEEIFDGYKVDIPSLFKTFSDEGKDQLVVAKVNTWSVCEHHILPFSVSAAVGYLPDNKVIGVSKLSRLVCAYSHRLQLQERITEQVAQAIMRYLEPKGVAVVITGEHLCMRMRGVKDQESQVITSVMLGAFRDDFNLRQEFLRLIK